MLKFKKNPRDMHGYSFSLFLLEVDDVLTGNSFLYSGKFAFIKKKIKRSKRNGKCVDFEKTYRQLNCTSKRHCLDRCIARLFINKHHNIIVGDGMHPLVVDKDQFSLDEWQTSYPIISLFDEAYQEISRQCKNLTPNHPKM